MARHFFASQMLLLEAFERQKSRRRMRVIGVGKVKKRDEAVEKENKQEEVQYSSDQAPELSLISFRAQQTEYTDLLYLEEETGVAKSRIIGWAIRETARWHRSRLEQLTIDQYLYNIIKVYPRAIFHEKEYTNIPSISYRPKPKEWEDLLYLSAELGLPKSRVIGLSVRLFAAKLRS